MPINKREKPTITDKDLKRLNDKIKFNNNALNEKKNSLLKKLDRNS